MASGESQQRGAARAPVPGADGGPPFAALRGAGVRWCLWRGTARLERAYSGRSDFDALVDPAQRDRLAAALADAGWRPSATRDNDAGLEDWFGLGGPAGPLLHFHVHYRLVAGEPRLNRFRLPFEDDVLDARSDGGADGPDVAAAVDEAALLIVRCSLQLRWRDFVPGAPGGRRTLAKVRGDLEWLGQQQLAAVRTRLESWLGNDIAAQLPDRSGDVTLGHLRRLRRGCAARLADHAELRGAAAALQLWRRELRAGLRRLARRLDLPLLPARGARRGGIVAALDGADPARRRALADELAAVFAGKFDVIRVRSPRRWPRARRARQRGMLALVDDVAWCDAREVDLVLEVAAADAGVGPLLARLWQLF